MDSVEILSAKRRKFHSHILNYTFGAREKLLDFDAKQGALSRMFNCNLQFSPFLIVNFHFNYSSSLVVEFASARRVMPRQ